MLKVRLQRTGKRGQAYFRVVVVEHTKKPRGKFLELLGNYDPHKKELKVDMERINHWVSNGAQVSSTVNNLLVNYKYWDKPKMPSWKPKKKPARTTEAVQSCGEKPAETKTPSVASSGEVKPETQAPTEVKTEALPSEPEQHQPAPAEDSSEVKPEAQPAV